MRIYRKKRKWKFLLVLFAFLIGSLSLWYTNSLMKKLSAEELKRIELWAEATQHLIMSDPEHDVSFLFEVLRNNETIPVILVDMEDNILSFRNLDTVKMMNPQYSQKKLKEFQTNNKQHFVIKTDDGIELNKIYYSDSSLLKQLQYYPYIQLALVFLFILVSYFAFSVSRQAEQDQVWLGMSKETAHQLGTPISSLMAWKEIIKETGTDPSLVVELEKDINRLEKITERFSKIGSQPVLEKKNINEVLESSIGYIKSRVPKSIQIIFNPDKTNNVYVPVNQELFEWVIENLCKNAVDAIGESGRIDIVTQLSNDKLFIDIIDTGKGISKSNYKNVFSPGFTTKNRGWGLGLSLVKRIIEQYHKGKVFVKNSEINVGTTFRIILSL